jgi:DNA-binding transcriptional ArsR family regulator
MVRLRRDVFQAIADPTRREIINLIAHKSLNLSSIAEKFDMSRPAISQHIKLLTECGLIVIHKQGRQRFCQARLQQLSEVSDWIDPYRKLWTGRFNVMETMFKEMQAKSTSERITPRKKGKRKK